MKKLLAAVAILCCILPVTVKAGGNAEIAHAVEKQVVSALAFPGCPNFAELDQAQLEEYFAPVFWSERNQERWADKIVAQARTKADRLLKGEYTFRNKELSLYGEPYIQFIILDDDARRSVDVTATGKVYCRSIPVK